jgi:hypothetical protein
MRRSRIASALVVAAGLLLSAMPSAAQTAVADKYDTTKTVTLNGTLRVWNFGRPHTYMVVDTKDANGAAEQWTVETGSTVDLLKAGVDVGARGTLKAGEPIVVVVYLPKAGVQPDEIPDTVRDAVIDILKAGKRVYGVEATFSKDGKKYVIAGQ